MITSTTAVGENERLLAVIEEQRRQILALRHRLAQVSPGDPLLAATADVLTPAWTWSSPSQVPSSAPVPR